jgi:hypothetical protein
MKYFLIHKDLPAEIRANLSFFGECVPLPVFEKLPVPVCAHPDMLIAQIGGQLLIHEEYRQGRELLSSLGIPFSLSHTPVSAKYPEDIRLNCFCVGDRFISNEKYVSRDALRIAKEWGFRSVSVPQGYAKCSCAVAGNAVATADRGIEKILRRDGADVLLLPPCSIGIEVYDTGFLGGASVLLDEKTLGFFGDIRLFAQYDVLRDFFACRGVSLVSLGKGPLFDYGGAITVSV